MKFSIGDKVVLKRTGEEGRVTAFIDKQLVEVEVNGTAFPVYLEEVDHPYLKWFTEKGTSPGRKPAQQEIAVEKPAVRAPRLAKGIYLSFMPEFKMVDMEEIPDTVKVYLLNELPVSTKYSYEARGRNESLFKHEGTIHAFGNVYLHSIPYIEMSDQPRFHWSLQDAGDNMMAKEENILRIKPAKLFEHISKIMEGGAPSFSYLLIDGFKPQPAEKEETFVPVVRAGRVDVQSENRREEPRHELDLHIEQLLDNVKGLTNAEIIHIQLSTLQRYLQLAISARQDRMVVIHGLGKGKLREEVHNVLKTMPEVARYKNEWSGRYGFGATEIFFRYT